jgi:hypothetical protein
MGNQGKGSNRATSIRQTAKTSNSTSTECLRMVSKYMKDKQMGNSFGTEKINKTSMVTKSKLSLMKMVNHCNRQRRSKTSLTPSLVSNTRRRNSQQLEAMVLNHLTKIKTLITKTRALSAWRTCRVARW